MTALEKLTAKQRKYLTDLLDGSGQCDAVIGDTKGEGIDYDYAKTHYECCIALGHEVEQSKIELQNLTTLREKGTV